MHPIIGYTINHKGVDFGVAHGPPIMAAGSGVVVEAGWKGGYGRYVRIRHNNEYSTAYAHMSKFGRDIKAGTHVTQGQIIGYVGMTGDATGPHLHYEVLKDGSQVNPINVTVPPSTGLEGSALVAFMKTVDEREQRVAALIDSPQFASLHK